MLSIVPSLSLILHLARFANAASAIVRAADPNAFSHFVTRPDIEAPKWNIEIYHEAALQKDFYWFVSPYMKLNQDVYPMWNGPFIYRTNGELVWSGGSRFDYLNVHDFRMSIVDNRMMLSMIRDKPNASAELYDESYTLHKAVDITSDFGHPNMHDFNVINNGKSALALLREGTSTMPLKGHETCEVKYEGFIEVDIATNKKIFQWDPRGWIPLVETDELYHEKSIAEVCEKRPSIDVLHVNAIDKFDDGDYLLSARNTDTLYKISHIDGSIVWRLGGPFSDFAFGPGARFERQHHARFLGQNDTHIFITLFNNGLSRGFYSQDARTDRSAGFVLVLSMYRMTAEVLRRFDKPSWHTMSESEEDQKNKTKTRGSMSILPNGNAFIGWVDGSHISEHSPTGTLLMQAKFSRNEISTYRSYKMQWIGRPKEPPAVVAKVMRKKNGETFTLVHVSWNGATEVEQWKVSGVGRRSRAPSDGIAIRKSSGFETRISLPGRWKSVVAAGFDAQGQELGHSRTVAVSDGDGPASVWSAAWVATIVAIAVLSAVCLLCWNYNFRQNFSRWRLLRSSCSEKEKESLIHNEKDKDRDGNKRSTEDKRKKKRISLDWLALA